MMHRGWMILGLVTAASCGSGSGTSEPSLTYSGGEPVLLRVGEDVELAPDQVRVGTYEARSALPAGLRIESATGVLSGSPTAATGSTTIEIACTGATETATARLQLAIGPALPVAVGYLAEGFMVERFAGLGQVPSDLEMAPDGRLFVTELMTGAVRIIGADGVAQADPFASETVASGGHKGMLGIALSPTFAADGLVFAMFVAAAAGGDPERSQVVRWREVNGVGTERTVLLDDLPAATINNGGALCFDADGLLLVSVGDTEDPVLSQMDDSLAGKVLRIDPVTGAAASGNGSGTRVHAKGLRNVFAMALDPSVGAVLAADNGPATDDELVLLRDGKNYEWGGVAGSYGADTGAVLRHWEDVIVPTGLAYRRLDATNSWPEAAAAALYMTLYDEQKVERFDLSGAQRTDIDAESTFLEFTVEGNNNIPIDVEFGADGRMWVLTNAAVFVVDAIR